jgi:hypothetical protein
MRGSCTLSGITRGSVIPESYHIHGENLRLADVAGEAGRYGVDEVGGSGGAGEEGESEEGGGKSFLEHETKSPDGEISFSSYRTHRPGVISLQGYCGNRVFALEIFLFQNK